MWRAEKTPRTASMLGKVCFSLPVRPHSTLILFYSSNPTHTNSQAISGCLSAVRENTSTERRLFSSSKPVTPQKRECYLLSEMCYRCNPPMLLSGKTNEHQFSFITFHFRHTHTCTHTHMKSSAPAAEDILYYTAGADTLFAADSVCFSRLMELSVPRAQSEYCGQPQSINDLRLAF